MEIITKAIDDLKPYENNPRKNEAAVPYVANSIREFGFRVPVIIDKNNVIVAGHTRVLAAQELELDEVPCIVADDLTDEQIKAFRIVDNKVGEIAAWDYIQLEQELADIDGIYMADFGFPAVESMDFDDVFSDSVSSASAPKMITCPHCGERFEKGAAKHDDED